MDPNGLATRLMATLREFTTPGANHLKELDTLEQEPLALQIAAELLTSASGADAFVLASFLISATKRRWDGPGQECIRRAVCKALPQALHNEYSLARKQVTEVIHLVALAEWPHEWPDALDRIFESRMNKLLLLGKRYATADDTTLQAIESLLRTKQIIDSPDLDEAIAHILSSRGPQIFALVSSAISSARNVLSNNPVTDNALGLELDMPISVVMELQNFNCGPGCSATYILESHNSPKARQSGVERCKCVNNWPREQNFNKDMVQYLHKFEFQQNHPRTLSKVGAQELLLSALNVASILLDSADKSEKLNWLDKWLREPLEEIVSINSCEVIMTEVASKILQLFNSLLDDNLCGSDWFLKTTIGLLQQPQVSDQMWCNALQVIFKLVESKASGTDSVLVAVTQPALQLREEHIDLFADNPALYCIFDSESSARSVIRSFLRKHNRDQIGNNLKFVLAQEAEKSKLGSFEDKERAVAALRALQPSMGISLRTMSSFTPVRDGWSTDSISASQLHSVEDFFEGCKLTRAFVSTVMRDLLPFLLVTTDTNAGTDITSLHYLQTGMLLLIANATDCFSEADISSFSLPVVDLLWSSSPTVVHAAVLAVNSIVTRYMKFVKKTSLSMNAYFSNNIQLLTLQGAILDVGVVETALSIALSRLIEISMPKPNPTILNAIKHMISTIGLIKNLPVFTLPPSNYSILSIPTRGQKAIPNNLPRDVITTIQDISSIDQYYISACPPKERSLLYCTSVEAIAARVIEIVKYIAQNDSCAETKTSIFSLLESLKYLDENYLMLELQELVNILNTSHNDCVAYAMASLSLNKSTKPEPLSSEQQTVLQLIHPGPLWIRDAGSYTHHIPRVFRALLCRANFAANIPVLVQTTEALLDAVEIYIISGYSSVAVGQKLQAELWSVSEEKCFSFMWDILLACVYACSSYFVENQPLNERVGTLILKMLENVTIHTQNLTFPVTVVGLALSKLSIKDQLAEFVVAHLLKPSNMRLASVIYSALMGEGKRTSSTMLAGVISGWVNFLTHCPESAPRTRIALALLTAASITTLSSTLAETIDGPNAYKLDDIEFTGSVHDGIIALHTILIERNGAAEILNQTTDRERGYLVKAISELKKEMEDLSKSL